MSQALRVQKLSQQLRSNLFAKSQTTFHTSVRGSQANSLAEVGSKVGGIFLPSKLSGTMPLTPNPGASFIPVRGRVRGRQQIVRNPAPAMKAYKPEYETVEVLQRDLPLPLPRLPCCGLVASPSRELLVVGTAHTPCQSAAQVKAIIAKARPDVVVIELDPDRLAALLQGADPSKRNYGEDFVAAATTASSVGAHIILGDAEAEDTFRLLRTIGPLADGKRLARGLQLAAKRFGRSSSDALRIQPVSELASLMEDPGKLLPLLAASWWWLGTAVLPPLVVGPGSVSDGGLADMLVAAGFSSFLLAVGVRFFDVVLLRRDDVLASKVLKGLEVAHGLSSGRLLRRRYHFSTDLATLLSAPLPPLGKVPFFTLFRPLVQGEVRKLTIDGRSPRWLALLYSLAADRTMNEGGKATFGPPELLINQTFGCVLTVSRYYSQTVTEGNESINSERVADVVILLTARRARIIKAKQSTRSVMGARQVSIWILGEEPLRLEDASLEVTERGYLAGHATPCSEAEHAASMTILPEIAADDGSEISSRPIRVVAVVGLAHANGVLDRCAESYLQDTSAITRTVEESATG